MLLLNVIADAKVVARIQLGDREFTATGIEYQTFEMYIERKQNYAFAIFVIISL
jgi:hypothetical protein